MVALFTLELQKRINLAGERRQLSAGQVESVIAGRAQKGPIVRNDQTCGAMVLKEMLQQNLRVRLPQRRASQRRGRDRNRSQRRGAVVDLGIAKSIAFGLAKVVVMIKKVISRNARSTMAVRSMRGDGMRLLSGAEEGVPRGLKPPCLSDPCDARAKARAYPRSKNNRNRRAWQRHPRCAA